MDHANECLSCTGNSAACYAKDTEKNKIVPTVKSRSNPWDKCPRGVTVLGIQRRHIVTIR